jgi:cytochrome c-type biogenesis protein CcmH/NrfG
MNNILIAAQYAHTREADMLALDVERRKAEADCTSGETWAGLARQYEAQGRPSMAARCYERARNYREME